jgi:hypothetical protein
MDVCEAEWGHTTDVEFDYHGPLIAALAGSLVPHEVQTFIGFDIAFYLFASIVPLGESSCKYGMLILAAKCRSA